MSYIIRNQYGAFCAVCQHHLGFEEDSFDCCDVCGGDGWPEEHDDDPYEAVAQGENWTEIRLKEGRPLHAPVEPQDGQGGGL